MYQNYNIRIPDIVFLQVGNIVFFFRDLLWRSRKNTILLYYEDLFLNHVQDLFFTSAPPAAFIILERQPLPLGLWPDRGIILHDPRMQ